MKKRRLHFSAKLRQYRYLAKRIDRAISEGSFQLLSASRKKELLRQLKMRLRKIAPIVSERKMKNALAGMAMLLATTAGAQSFAPPVASPFGLPATQDEETLSFPYFVDIDNDGDLDLMDFRYSDSYGERQITFVENTGTPEAPAFDVANSVANPFGLDLGMEEEYTAGAFVDLDNDGDFDFMAGSANFDDNTGIYYFENIGSPEEALFAARQANPFGIVSPQMYNLPAFADLDDDGDQDLYCSGQYGNHAYFENVGTAEMPSFAAPVTDLPGIALPFAANGNVQFPALVDLDLDGDYDLMISELTETYEGYSVNFVFFENIGTPAAPTFNTPQANPFGLQNEALFFPGTMAMADIDNDGDVDLFAGDYSYNSYLSQIFFYENLTDPVSTQNNELRAEINLSPNPVQDFCNINISTQEILNDLHFTIVDVNGKEISAGTIDQAGIKSNIAINVSHFPSGIYFVKIFSEGKIKTARFFKE